MPAKRRTNTVMDETGHSFAPKIYYFHPFLAGPQTSWPQHFRRCQDMGFSHVLTAPLFAPGQQGDIFLTGDHDQVHPALNVPHSADNLFEDFAQTCRKFGLSLLADVVLGRVAPDAALARLAPSWFHSDDVVAQRLDPRSPLRRVEAAYARFDDIAIAKEVANWWVERLQRLARVGVTGFRCLEPQLVPPHVWRDVIAAVKTSFPDSRFLAWTPGLGWSDIVGLRGIGFTAAFSSLPWWDGRASWFVEEHELLRDIGVVIACPETPFGPRLARRFENSENLPAIYRRQLRCAAATGNGLMVPMGFEFVINQDMEDHPAVNNGFSVLPDASNSDVTMDICEANALSDQLVPLGVDELRMMTNQGRPVTGLLRSDTSEVRRARAPIVVIMNSDLDRDQAMPISLHPLPPAAGASLSALEVISADSDSSDSLNGGEVRVLRARRNELIKSRSTNVSAATLTTAPRIVIDNVAPSVDQGRFAAKRIIGDAVVIEADVFADGHDVLAVELLWRAVDETEWRRKQMQLLNNDRWQATIQPDRVGRYDFTVEAWFDKYGTLCRDLETKRAAGVDIAVEVAEALALLTKTKERTEDSANSVVTSALNWLREASMDSSAEILLTPDLREVMHEAEERNFRCRREPSFALEVERPQAAFSAWYELFPRSASDTPGQHGTFADVIRRLPAIKDMGFDVLYLSPIHPIGTTNRKGKNNNLRAEPGDVGSPYAIGSSGGGHDALHPELGTISDFRRLRDAAATHGMELAIDFAIQCSPDHPWLKDHPEWFNWRADGSVRYAENPPKKYEDIVNVDFYAENAIPNLWIALRDIVRFWVKEGVRIFRVDNPHTKPLPFWEWLIGQVRSQYPDVIFLSEAFTRPKIMYRLAKLGFSQSYTYFTWRNTKQELIDYFTELTTSDVKEFFRPHLFVNTPDINPYFLQNSGRPGFLIRAALAATLSGLWGLYSGFELCEASALPGREEYLDSEKYELRQRCFDAPGNIVAEISKLNRIRKSNPAMQSHMGLRFYPAHSNQVILYGKPLPARDDMILIAISLDPFHVQEAMIEVPLWEWNLPDSGIVTVHDLMRGNSFVWNGKLQQIRLDPTDLPFAIWRITPHLGS
jgi:starch synthase (maltosyl-transferring)